MNVVFTVDTVEVVPVDSVVEGLVTDVVVRLVLVLLVDPVVVVLVLTAGTVVDKTTPVDPLDVFWLVDCIVLDMPVD
jgi:hypothetical protein